ncbi:hypothetical protein E2C01_024207 [Portunus trituberculatus]|uniref:Uncharacterized protein n=1 Tax=Portunus trituberculatus TaxID=210409 RepID=A0A5B7EC40_PORTR|nr:hypothetical protein [Portunus trituberculatus]
MPRNTLVKAGDEQVVVVVAVVRWMSERGKLVKGNNKLKKRPTCLPVPLKIMSYPKFRDKCLETSFLKKVKS